MERAERERMAQIFIMKNIRIMSLISKLSLIFKGFSLENSNEENTFKENDFFDTCKLLRTQREKCGLSRKELAKKTKISIVVLEALEKGWTNNFPEKTFLKQMLLTIELQLYLPRNRLISILSKSNTPSKVTPIKTFTPWNVDIFRSWQGNLIYFLLMALSIIALNKQQNYLSGIKVITIEPFKNELNKLDKQIR